MITQVNQFISTIVAELRTTTFVQNKIAEGSWKTGSPYYWFGTPMEINNTLNNIRDGRNKFPAVFLFEPFSVVENEDMMLNVGATPTVNLYFLQSWAGMEKWLTSDHYTNIIDDMDTLKREFIKKLKGNKYVLQVETYNTTRHVKMGIFVANKGYKTPIFDAQTSGVELSITFDIDKIIDGCNLFE